MTEKVVDVSKHIYVPKHEKLQEQEVTDLLEKYNLSLTQLPKIFLKDPAIEMLEPQIGDVIKISRASPTAGRAVYYRAVVNG